MAGTLRAALSVELSRPTVKNVSLKSVQPWQIRLSGDMKDSCYKKVKANYKVFPSAYASGAIAKCRKKKASGKKPNKKGYAKGGYVQCGASMPPKYWKGK